MLNSVALSIATVVVLSSTLSAANEPGGEHPCKKIEAACTAAGYVKGGAKEGKGLFKDCVMPIINGQAVTGVSVDPGDAQLCKQKWASKKAGPQ